MQIKELSLGDFVDVARMPDLYATKRLFQEQNVAVLVSKINEIIRFVNKEEK